MESLNPIDQIQVPVIIAMMGLVVLTFFLLRRVFFAPYVAVMERRETQLETAETTIAEAERIVAETEPEAQAIVAAAREKASDVLSKSRDDVEGYRGQVIEAAMQEAAHELESGRAKIAAERETEVTALREQSIECVTMACDKLLGSVEPAAVAASVDKFLARRAY